jgi:hypothetical protein
MWRDRWGYDRADEYGYQDQDPGAPLPGAVHGSARGRTKILHVVPYDERLRKIGSKWLIVRDNLSVPVDFETGKALPELTPWFKLGSSPTPVPCPSSFEVASFEAELGGPARGLAGIRATRDHCGVASRHRSTEPSFLSGRAPGESAE